MPLPELVAHRGYPRRYPENTLPGIEAALRLGAPYVEVDVQLSADGVPWLHHDRTLRRMCGVWGAVHARTSADLAALRAPERRAHGDRFADLGLARLDEIAPLLAGHPAATLFVDLKNVGLERFGAGTVVARVRAALDGLSDRAVPIAFVPEVVTEARRQGFRKAGLIVKRFRQVAGDGCAAVAPDYVFCDVAALPSAGPLASPVAPLAVYDVVDPDLARALGERGAALVETFAIGEMLEALARPSPRDA